MSAKRTNLMERNNLMNKRQRRHLRNASHFVCWFILSVTSAFGHDTWVESGSLLNRVSDPVYVDLKLGNHGNSHRDFKLASKITLKPCTLSLLRPDGQTVDLKGQLFDAGYAPKEGYWSTRYIPTEAGVHGVYHTLDTLHGETRALKTAKTVFLSARAQGMKTYVEPSDLNYVDRPLGFGLELVLKTPVGGIAAGNEMTLELRLHGLAVEGIVVSFVPKGKQLAEGFDSDYERHTDANGIVRFTPGEAETYLIVAHLAAPMETGEGYTKTHYSATFVLAIPGTAVAPLSESSLE